ncbi:tetratricopeptide repeat protein [Candidatus Nitronereus thalassa]|uniref:Tetratricopeptide repeat protein n=1 Tax=Candidatus Nitronereus thalassa TaxID=3020898 RepID=A0ABU3K3P2_9BACT|nr:tetratricopeptide repeat protein [Candidatus Nitronereus thalassa]MDT7041009.1 tetratricopeptide repeat protein [Candidatus Nitronereus thalassa]
MKQLRCLFLLVLLGLPLYGCSGQESPWEASLREAQEAIEQKEYAYAEGLLTKALPQAEMWGESDSRLASVLYSLGEVYRRQHDLAKAEPYFWRALPIWTKSVGAEHPNMANALTSLAQIYQDRQEYQKAEPLIKQALKIREKAFGMEHPQIASTLEVYGSLMNLMNREEEAGKLHARREAILRQ